MTGSSGGSTWGSVKDEILIENNRAKGFETTLSKSSSEISKIIEKPFNNKEITEQEAEKLFLIDNTTDLSSLVIAADIARKEDVLTRRFLHKKRLFFFA